MHFSCALQLNSLGFCSCSRFPPAVSLCATTVRLLFCKDTICSEAVHSYNHHCLIPALRGPFSHHQARVPCLQPEYIAGKSRCLTCLPFFAAGEPTEKRLNAVVIAPLLHHQCLTCLHSFCNKSNSRRGAILLEPPSSLRVPILHRLLVRHCWLTCLSFFIQLDRLVEQTGCQTALPWFCFTLPFFTPPL